MYFCISVRDTPPAPRCGFANLVHGAAPLPPCVHCATPPKYRNTEIHLPSSFYTKHTINITGHTPHQHMHSAGQPTASAQECTRKAIQLTAHPRRGATYGKIENFAISQKLLYALLYICFSMCGLSICVPPTDVSRPKRHSAILISML